MRANRKSWVANTVCWKLITSITLSKGQGIGFSKDWARECGSSPPRSMPSCIYLNYDCAPRKHNQKCRNKLEKSKASIGKDLNIAASKCCTLDELICKVKGENQSILVGLSAVGMIILMMVF